MKSNMLNEEKELKQRKMFIKGIRTVVKLRTLDYNKLSDEDLGKLAAAILKSNVTDYIIKKI